MHFSSSPGPTLLSFSVEHYSTGVPSTVLVFVLRFFLVTIRVSCTQCYLLQSCFQRTKSQKTQQKTCTEHPVLDQSFDNFIMGSTVPPGESSRPDATKYPTAALCDWVESVTWSSIPEDVRTRAKFLLLDGVGCALVGARLPWSVKARNAMVDLEMPGRCSIFGWNEVN